MGCQLACRREFAFEGSPDGAAQARARYEADALGELVNDKQRRGAAAPGPAHLAYQTYLKLGERAHILAYFETLSITVSQVRAPASDDWLQLE